MLQVRHKSLDEIPEPHRELYTEQDGEFVLTGIVGVKSQADIDRMNAGLQKERDEHKATKDKLHAWDGFGTPDELQQKLDKMAELEVAAKQSGTKEEIEARLEELAEARVRSRVAPFERENVSLKTKLETAEKALNESCQELQRRDINDAVTKAALDAKILPEAMQDVIMLANAVMQVTDDGQVLVAENQFGSTPGLAPDIWIKELQDKRPHWWPRSVGGDAKGSGGKGGAGQNNPWSREHWNLTEQGRLVRELGLEKAGQMAKMAGTTIGGSMPPAKK